MRELVWQLLQDDRVERTHIPGISAPSWWETLATLDAARHDADGVAFLSCYGTSRPYVVCPPSLVACTESDLLQLTRDLAESEHQEPDQGDKAGVFFFRIPAGERVWNMDIGDARHARYNGRLWIRESVPAILKSHIAQVLAGG